jgi:hypothetical protein
MASMMRFVLPLGLAVFLPACGGSTDVSCSYQQAGTVKACADYSVSGNTQGADVVSVEQNACTAGMGTVVDTCPTANTLGICTITISAGGATVSAAERLYAVNGETAATAQMACQSQNGVNGVMTSWSAQ